MSKLLETVDVVESWLPSDDMERSLLHLAALTCVFPLVVGSFVVFQSGAL